MGNNNGKKPDPWAITLNLPRRPRCPGCGSLLTQPIVMFAYNWAWCGHCCTQALWRQHIWQKTLQDPSVRRHSIIKAGLQFFSPIGTPFELKNALEISIESSPA